MKLLFTRHFGIYLLLLTLVAGGGWYAFSIYTTSGAELPELTTVTLADITESITVSGKTAARQIATLSFPVTGIIQQIYPRVGEMVSTGDIMASLTTDAVVAEYNAALEQVRYAEEIKQELLRGPVQTERAVARSNVQITEAQISQTETDFTKAITNARRNLLSSGLAAYPTSVANATTPPTISGNYLCEKEGRYQIDVYASSASSKYSYHLTDLESGLFNATINYATPLGTCGLYIQFFDDQRYHNTTWIVEIPNKRNPTYVQLKNTYEQLVSERTTALSTARENVLLAQSREQALITPASTEILNQADANIATAKAQLAVQEARITDYTIKAPFTGAVSNIDMKIGEAALADKTITMVFEGDYELKAQIPEIDITKVALGNLARVTFDADPSVSFEAEVTFISPLSSNLSGVAYYEAYIALKDSPSWLREGLNADIRIESKRLNQVPTLPRRFIQFEAGVAYVFTNTDDQLRIPVKTGFTGTDGRTEIINIPVGTEILLP